MAQGRGRPKKEDAKTVAVQVRLTPDRVEGLDELVAEHQAAAPAGEVSRASVLRHLLDRALEERGASQKGRAKR